MVVAALCTIGFALGVDGPPTLPPLPGRGVRGPVEEEKASPQKPAKPDPAKPEPAKPEPAKPEPAPEPSAADPSAPPPTVPGPIAREPAPGEFLPDAAVPPQPDVGGPPAEPASDSQTRAPPLDEPETPGIPGADEGAKGIMRPPPPTRPPFRGTGLFIGAGVTFAVALAEQIVAHVIVKRRCIDPIANDEVENVDDFSEVSSTCAPGVLPAVALRVHSDIGLLATIGLAAGGSFTRARRDAYDDVFKTSRRRKTMGLLAGGISLISAGFATWFISGASAWAWLGRCKSSKCATSARLLAFTMRDVSAIMVASGSGMLSWSEGYRKSHDSYSRDKAISVSPALTWDRVGLNLTGRF